MSEKKRNEVPEPELTAEEKAAGIPTWAPWWPSPRASELTAAEKAAHVPLEAKVKRLVPERELTEKEKAEAMSEKKKSVVPERESAEEKKVEEEYSCLSVMKKLVPHSNAGLFESSEKRMMENFVAAAMADAKEHAARKAAGTLYEPDDGIVFPDGDDCLNDYLTPEELAEQKAERVAEQRARLAAKDKKP